MSMRRAFGICPDCNGRHVHRRRLLVYGLNRELTSSEPLHCLACNHRFWRELAKSEKLQRRLFG